MSEACPLRIAISGSRDWTDKESIYKLISFFDPDRDEFILGDAKGADTLAKNVCEKLGFKHVVCYAKWKKFGKAAGHIRNAEMLAHEPDVLYYFNDDLENSKGTKNCVKQAEKLGITVYNGDV